MNIAALDGVLATVFRTHEAKNCGCFPPEERVRLRNVLTDKLSRGRGFQDEIDIITKELSNSEFRSRIAEYTFADHG